MTKVFKIGGNVIDNPEALMAFCRDFASVPGPKILVHGGGAVASSVQKALGQTPVKIDGRRVTDEAALDVAVMVYSGLCSKRIVSLLQSEGVDAVGLSGCDASVITASRRGPVKVSDGRTVDYGYVGDVTPESVNTGRLEMFLDAGLVPVLNAINHDGKGQLLNTNADTIAASVAAALRAELVCCFELDGVLEDIGRPDSVIPSINEAAFEKMKAEGSVSQGMIPKISNALAALRGGAAGAVIKNASAICAEGGTVIEL